MNVHVARDLAIFMVSVLFGILIACCYFAYGNEAKEIFAPLFGGLA
jgi:cbb3-type cytochrome oxidase subunit 3